MRSNIREGNLAHAWSRVLGYIQLQMTDQYADTKDGCWKNLKARLQNIASLLGARLACRAGNILHGHYNSLKSR